MHLKPHQRAVCRVHLQCRVEGRCCFIAHMAYAPVACFGGGVHGLQHGLDFVDVMGDQHAGWSPHRPRRRRLPAARGWVKSIQVPGVAARVIASSRASSAYPESANSYQNSSKLIRPRQNGA